MYCGECHLALDDKGRIMVPKEFRVTMDSEDHDVWFITRGYDGALFLFPKERWASLVGICSDPAPLEPRMLDFRRVLVGSAAKAKRDPQGRMNVPDHLREYAGIGGKAVLIGVGDHLELFSEEGWRAYLASQQEQYKAQGSELFGVKPLGASPNAGGEQHVKN